MRRALLYMHIQVAKCWHYNIEFIENWDFMEFIGVNYIKIKKTRYSLLLKIVFVINFYDYNIRRFIKHMKYIKFLCCWPTKNITEDQPIISE